MAGHYENINEPGFVYRETDDYRSGLYGGYTIGDPATKNPCSEIPMTKNVMFPVDWDSLSFKAKMEWLYNRGLFTESDKMEDNLEKLGL